MLLSRVLTFFHPIRGLLVVDSGRGPLSTVAMCMYICVTSIFLFLCFLWEERPSDSARFASLTTSTDVCLPVLILVGPSWRPSWSPRCNRSVFCDCAPSLLNVRWSSSCRHYSNTILMYVNKVFIKNKNKKFDWMLVSWDHRSEHGLTREPRGPELAGRLTSSINNALDGASPPVRWKVMLSGLQSGYVFFVFFVLFVMLSPFHISRAFPSGVLVAIPVWRIL